jgi:hypothetical protein
MRGVSTLRAPCAVLLSIATALAVLPVGRSVARAAPSASLSNSTSSPADEPAAARAARLKTAGDRAFDDKRYGDALEAYGASFALLPNPVLLYNQGRALQFLGRYPEALEFLNRFRAEASPSLRAKVPTLDALIEEVESRVGTLAVDADVVGALVMLGERKLGLTPLAPLRVNAGRYPLEVTAEGREPFRTTVEVEGRKTVRVTAALAPKSRTGVLVVRSSTAGARVTIDGVAAGAAPVERTLDKGDHAVQVEAPGYEPTSTTVVVTAGARRDLSIELRTRPAITSRWWFWTGVAAVAVAGVATVVILRTERSPDHGSFSPGTISGSLVRF